MPKSLPAILLFILALNRNAYSQISSAGVSSGHSATSSCGKIVYRKFVAPSILGNPGGEDPMRHMTIYLPPGYDRSTRRYPVIYLLHGYGGRDSSTMAYVRFDELIDASVAAGHTRPVILVLPDSYTTQR